MMFAKLARKRGKDNERRTLQIGISSKDVFSVGRNPENGVLVVALEITPDEARQFMDELYRFARAQ